MPETYNYQDESGEVLYRVVRYGEKQFRQEHPENGGWKAGRGVDNTRPYRLPEVLDAIDLGEPIWIFEGEKDVETARLQGLVGTCNSGGAGKWNDELSHWLRAAEPVYICWDNDQQGRRHALMVEQSLKAVGVLDVRFRRALVGNDFTDHIVAGKTVADLARRRPKVEVVQEQDADDAEEDYPSAAFQLALNKLNKVTPELGKRNQYNALCPAHDDVNPSLSIRPGGPGDSVNVLVACHAHGCSPAQIARALGINPAEFTAMPVAGLDKQDALNEQAYMRKKANEHADQKLMQERALSVIKFGSRVDTGKDELAKPLVPTKWFIDSWFKSSTAVLLNADPKAGKTRLALNLMRSLTENEPFLGRFQTSLAQDERVWYGNWDQPEDLMREYLHDYNWLASDRFLMEHIGSMEFPFWVPSVFDDFVQYAQRMQIGLMIVDTLHVASQGYVTDENDNNEMSAFVHLLRKLVKAAGIGQLLVIHHTGHSTAARGRGASTLAADFDGMWFLNVSESEKFDSPRSLSAKGRKLGVQPVELVYNMATESYSYRGSLPARAGSDSVDPDLMKEYLRFADKVSEYHRERGSWPTVKVARSFIHKKTSVVSEFLRACQSLNIVVRVAGKPSDLIQVP
jgi:hypothetical protein